MLGDQSPHRPEKSVLQPEFQTQPALMGLPLAGTGATIRVLRVPDPGPSPFMAFAPLMG